MSRASRTTWFVSASRLGGHAQPTPHGPTSSAQAVCLARARGHPYSRRPNAVGPIGGGNSEPLGGSSVGMRLLADRDDVTVDHVCAQVPSVAPPTSGLRDSVARRFRSLGAQRWGVLLPASRRHRRRLGLSPAQQLVIEQLLSHHDKAGVWRSFGQAHLANELGLSRSTLNEHLKVLRRKGCIAVREDAQHRGPAAPYSRATFFYIADPYLAAVALCEAEFVGGSLAPLLEDDAVLWLSTLLGGLADDCAQWQFGEGGTPHEELTAVLRSFLGGHPAKDSARRVLGRLLATSS
jgi:DNA-binding transcriptional ArsR family regulator